MKKLLFLLALPAFAQTSVVLNGNSYNLQSHPRVWLDGATGALTAAMSNTSGRANPSNPPYAAMQARVDLYIANGYTDPMVDYLYYDNTFLESPGDLASSTLNAALLWVAQGSNVSDPNGYLAAAKYGIDHALRMVGNSTGCNTSYSYCAPSPGRAYDQDFTRFFLIDMVQAYSLIRSQLTSTEISNFANWVLNDNTTAHNGIDTTACTNQTIVAGTGTLTASGLTVTISGGTTSQLVAGSVILNQTATMNSNSNSQQPVAIVNTITDSTHFTTYEPLTASGTAFNVSPPWVAGNCGMIWFVKHHNAAPPLIPAQAANYNTDYFNGNTFVSNDENLTLTALVGYIAVGLALADDDPRAVTLLQEAYDYYYTNMYPYTLSAFTGFTSSGNGYTNERTGWMHALIAEMVQKSVVSGPNLQGLLEKRLLAWEYQLSYPDSPTNAISFQQPNASLWNNAFYQRPGFIVEYMANSDPQAAFYNYYLRTTRGQYPGSTSYDVAYNKASYTPFSYVFVDPAFSQTNINTAPSQYLFNDTDYSTCMSLGLTCYPNNAYAFAVSRSGWSSTDDLALLTAGYTDGGDHSSNGDWGDFRIYRNGAYLLGDDFSSYSEGTSQENMLMIELGNGANWITPSISPFEANAPISRWSSTDPTGDSASRYMYVMTDLTNTYNNAAIKPTRVQRHVAHFKKPGAQDYFVVYDDVASPATTICGLWQFGLNGLAPSTAISYTPGTGPVSNTQTSSKLNTAWIFPGGGTSGAVTNDGSNGTYTGSNGFTYRVRSCASTDGNTRNAGATAFEELVVHEPVNGNSGSMPSLTQLPATNFRVVQIADATTPKVAAFAQGGVTYASLSFTSTHGGTGQYLIAGLTAGNYNVTVNNVAVVTNQPVNASDNTLYFESLSGAIVVSVTGLITLSGIAVSDTGQHYCRVVGDVSPDAYVQVYYGTVSGGPYPYNTYPYLTGRQSSPSDSGVFALDLGALASGTTFYFVAQARPNIDNTTGQVQTAEYSCTTTTGLPYPVAPTKYIPSYPLTTSGYTTISMTTSGSAFVAASTATHTGGVFCAGDPTWTVTAGDSLQTVLNEVQFGAIIEFPQGATGNAPNVTNGGFIEPPIAVDPCSSGISDPAHRWVILRTHQVNAADFPPFGFRTTPSWASKLANFQAQTPPHGLNSVGEVFSAMLVAPSTTGIHHFWHSNMEVSVNTGSTNNWGALVVLGDPYINGNDAPTPPSYMVFDRIYFNTPAPPSGVDTCLQGGIGANIFITGSYCAGAQNVGGGYVAQGIYITDCSIGPLTILNNEIDAAGQGVYFESVGRTDCGGTGPHILQNVSLLKNTLYSPPSWLNPINPGYGIWDGVNRKSFRNPIETKNTQYGLFQGNWIDGCFAGQNTGSCLLITPIGGAIKTTGATGAHDIEMSFNYLRHAAVISEAVGTSTIDGCCGYAPDAALNSQLLMHDNLAVDLGRYLYSFTGSPSVESEYLQSYGVQNHLIYNNTFDFTNAVWAPGAYYHPAILMTSDGGISSNGFQFTNNLLFFSQGQPASNAGIQAGGGGAGSPPPVCPYGCATFPVVPLPTTTTFATTLAGTMLNIAGAATASGNWGGNVMIGGNSGTSESNLAAASAANPMVLTVDSYTVSFFSVGANLTLAMAPGGITLGTGCSGMVGTFPITNISGTSVTVTHDNTGCAYTANSAVVQWPDMTQSDVTAAQGNMPPGDSWPNPSAGTMASRIAAAGLLKYANHSLILTPTAGNFGAAGGANIQGVLSNLGIVKSIVVQPGPSSLQFSYTAPDQNACSVDTSPDGTTWIRSAASGGSRNQTILVTGLSASTAYQYRLMCYYSQSRPWFSFPSESSNMATEGSSTTAASGTSTVSVGFSLPSGAASVEVTLTPLVGSAVTAACSASPCSVAGVANGANLETIQYWSGAGATGTMLSSGSTWLP